VLSALFIASCGSDNTTVTGAGAVPGDVFFRGQIQSITGTSLMVAGQLVVTDAGTVLHRNDAPARLSSFKVGERVRVTGAYAADGSVRAKTMSFPEN
jgi:hypothetical protein